MHPRLRALLASFLLVLAAGEAHAQAGDLARATCAGLNELRRPERAEILLWLHGYYAGAAQRSVLDRGRVSRTVAAVEAACERQPAMALIGSEARALFLDEAPVRDPAANPPAPSPPPAAEARRPADPSLGVRPSPVR